MFKYAKASIWKVATKSNVQKKTRKNKTSENKYIILIFFPKKQCSEHVFFCFFATLIKW